MTNIAGYPSAVISGTPGKSGRIQGLAPGVPFDPLQILNIVFWHDGQFGVVTDGGGNVSTWTDRSANGNDLTQATAGFRPNYNTGGAVNFLNFDGTDDTLGTGAYAGGDISQPSTGFFVFRKRSTGGVSEVAVDGLSTSKRNALFQSNPNWSMFSGTTQVFQAIDTIIHIFVLIFNTTASMLLEDGVSQGTKDTGTQVMDGLTIGSKFGNVGHMDADFYESIMYNRLITNSEINQVGNFLGSKYSITWTNV